MFGTSQSESSDRDESTDRSVTRSTLGRAARGLFGGVLAFMALDNLRNLDERVEYAEAKGAPAAEQTVPALSLDLLLGGIGVALWRLPSAAAAAVATFLGSATPVMHDFWAADDAEEQQQQLIHFLKNTALLGGALAFLKLARQE